MPLHAVRSLLGSVNISLQMHLSIHDSNENGCENAFNLKMPLRSCLHNNVFMQKTERFVFVSPVVYTNTVLLI